MRNIIMIALTVPLIILCIIGLLLGMAPAITLGSPFMIAGTIFIIFTEIKSKKSNILDLKKGTK